MGVITRRAFIGASACGLAAAGRVGAAPFLSGEPAPARVLPEGVSILNPRGRVPLSFIIDDSTCLVNMAHYGIPQFAEVFPDQYKQDWRKLPREIPDTFVREFAEWCHDHGVKGKYSIVPYPACTGWVDRFIPGWTKQELEASLQLVRDIIVPDWDIHPEMISHTRVIDIKTGRPYPEPSPDYMENWEWSQKKSADELAEYLAYALRVLKNAGLPCEGITTPGGFGSRNQVNLAMATLESVRDVYGAEIPHYFRDVFDEPGQSVAPRIYHASGLDGPDPRCSVSIIGCTGDWFGGWDGLEPGSVDRFITPDLQKGRMVEVIESGEPAIMVCHWPGIYYNGEKVGFNIFKEVVRRLDARYDHLQWMKLSEIARYWAAKELTRVDLRGNQVSLNAPFAAPAFTMEVGVRSEKAPSITAGGRSLPLREVKDRLSLVPGTFVRSGQSVTACFDLPRGAVQMTI